MQLADDKIYSIMNTHYDIVKHVYVTDGEFKAIFAKYDVDFPDKDEINAVIEMSEEEFRVDVVDHFAKKYSM